MLKIVLTGGSGSGKTAIQRVIQQSFGDQVLPVRELASEVLRDFNCAVGSMEPATIKRVQHEIYVRQKGREQEACEPAPAVARVLLLDRGTIDGAAYWPEGPEAFWTTMGTSHAAELTRYDAAVWLETAAAVGLYPGDVSNQLRKEGADDAVAHGDRILTLWQPHPNLTIVRAFPDFDIKVQTVVTIIRKLVDRAATATSVGPVVSRQLLSNPSK
jgi:predicted ATPase